MSQTVNPVGDPRPITAEQDRGFRPSQDTAPAEFGQFEALTRKLVNVPKSEIDKKRQGET